MKNLEALIKNMESISMQFRNNTQRSAIANMENNVLIEMLNSFTKGNLSKNDMIDMADYFLKNNIMTTRVA